MNYPTMIEIDRADRITISRWYRFLPTAGVNHISKSNFHQKCNEETVLMDRINERFEELGGMTHEISKIIKWR